MLEGDVLVPQDGAAQLPALFAEKHLMAPLGGGDGGLHAAHAPAGHQHPLLRRGRALEHALVFPPDQGVQGADAGLGLHPLRQAGEAAHAAQDLVGAVLDHLPGQLRVRQQSPAHGHHVRLPAFDDLLQHIRLVQGPDGRHGDADVLFDLRGEADVAAPVHIHGGVGLVEAVLVGPGGDVEQVDLALHQLRQFDGLPEVVAAGEALLGADAQLDGEVRPHGGADGVQNLQHQSGPVRAAAPVFVRAGVGGGRVELFQQPAVAGVDQEHVEARPLHQGRRLAVGLHDLPDHLPGHGDHPASVGHHLVHGAVFYLVPVPFPRAGVHGAEFAPVGQLDAGGGPVAADGPGQLGEPGQHVGVAQVDAASVAAAGGIVHHRLPHGDEGRAPLGPQLIEGDGVLGEQALRRQLRVAHGGGGHAVRESQPPQPQRLAEGGKGWRIHFLFSFCAVCATII